MGISVNQHVKMTQVKYQGENLDIHFTSMLVGDGYLWLMENLTSNMNFDSTFMFDLNNLCIVSSLKG